MFLGELFELFVGWCEGYTPVKIAVLFGKNREKTVSNFKLKFCCTAKKDLAIFFIPVKNKYPFSYFNLSMKFIMIRFAFCCDGKSKNSRKK